VVHRRRSIWFTLHRWLGIGLGLWFMLVGLTGALLVYRDAIDTWLNPALLVPRAAGPPLELSAIVERAQAMAELGRIERVRPPAGDNRVYRLQVRPLASRVESSRIEALLDPASGELLGTRSLERLSLAPPDAMRTLYEFHRNVLLGNWGSNIVGIAGVLLLASVISGVVTAWPRRRAGWTRLVWLNARASATRIAFDAHRSAGVLMAVVLLLSTLTGATLVYLNYVRDIVGLFSRVESFPTLPWRRTPGGDPVGFDEMVQRVREKHPQRRISEVHIPPRGNTGVLFYLTEPSDLHRLGDTIAWVHPVTGEILVERSNRTRSAGEAFMHWLFPLHTGSAFGPAGLLMMCIAGLMPLLLAGTGLWVWLRKRRGERISRERQSLRVRGG
jgi:uncharacterized iron-regulated membrane protein